MELGESLIRRHTACHSDSKHSIYFASTIHCGYFRPHDACQRLLTCRHQKIPQIHITLRNPGLYCGKFCQDTPNYTCDVQRYKPQTIFVESILSSFCLRPENWGSVFTFFCFQSPSATQWTASVHTLTHVRTLM